MRTLRLLVVSLVLSGGLSAQTFVFPADGAQVVPPVITAGGAELTATVDVGSGAVTITGEYLGLSSNATGAHLHGPAAPGVNGPVVLDLNVTGGTGGLVFGGGTLTAAEVDDLLAGLLYVDVASATWPAGEVRGQVDAEPSAEPFGGNPADSLVLLAGEPAMGAIFTLGVDNPVGSQPPGSTPFVGFALELDPLYVATGAGTPVFGWGMLPTVPGELLLSIVPPNPFGFVAGPPWIGPGVHAPVAVAVPNEPEVIGLTVYAQGALLDPGGFPEVGLTNGLELVIGL